MSLLDALLDFLDKWSNDIEGFGQAILGLLLLFIGVGVFAKAGLVPAVSVITTSVAIIEFFALPTIVGTTVLLFLWVVAFLVWIGNIVYKIYKFVK